MFHCCCCCCCVVGLCVPKLGTQRVLHSMCLVLQSIKFVNARPCSGGRGFKISSDWRISRSDWVLQSCMRHMAQCRQAWCDRAPLWGIRWENVRYWALQLLCINNFKHSCFCPLSWQVITSCRLFRCAGDRRLNSGWVGKVYKCAETWAQTGHRSDGQVRLNLAHAAVFGFVARTHAMQLSL